MAHILLLCGPVEDGTGASEPAKLRTEALDQAVARTTQLLEAAGHVLSVCRGRTETDLVDRVRQAPAQQVAIIVADPAAMMASGADLREALRSAAIPVIAVHPQGGRGGIDADRPSCLLDIATGTITGFGALGYELALMAAVHRLARH